MSYKEITGTLEYEPELRFTGMGVPLCTFRLLTERGKASCMAWESIGELLANSDFKAGTELTVSGQWKTRTYQSRHGGGTATAKDFHVTQFLVTS